MCAMEIGMPASLLDALGRALVALMAVVAADLLCSEAVRWRARFRHFHGPKGIPVFGNLLQLQMHAPEQLRQWQSDFGDVYQIQLGNIPALVVNSAPAAQEIFLHSGSAVNSRPVFHTFGKVVSKTTGPTIGLSPMSPDLKVRRRAAAAALNNQAVANYAGHLDVGTLALVQDLFTLGDGGKSAFNPMRSVYRFALSIIVLVNWGANVTSDDRVLFDEIIDVETCISSTRRVTENWQDYIPLLRLLPVTSKSQRANSLRLRRDKYLDRLDQKLKSRMEKKTAADCIQAKAMSDPEAKLTGKDLRTISISLLQGGTGTISGTISWAFLFLSQHPKIPEKALAEIRSAYPTTPSILNASVVEGRHFAERFPYVHALAKETLRYFTVLRLSLPRVTTGSITYESKPIPSGSMILLNAWACNMDAGLWNDPADFRPERWLEQPDAPLFTYGIGHRMCIGSTLANRELELVLLRVLGCFEILPSPGEKADASPWTGSANLREDGHSPKPFKVFFQPRDDGSLREVLDERQSSKG